VSIICAPSPVTWLPRAFSSSLLISTSKSLTGSRSFGEGHDGEWITGRITEFLRAEAQGPGSSPTQRMLASPTAWVLVLLALVVVQAIGTSVDTAAAGFPGVRPHKGKARIGVKMSPEAEREAPLPRESLFTSYAEDLRHARQDASSAIRYHQGEIKTYRSGNPDAVALYVQRCYGSGMTVEDAIVKHQQGIADAREELAEIEAAPVDHEQDLCQVLSSPAEEGEYAKARERFCELYGSDHPTHTQWLIARSATEGEMSCDRDLHAEGQWGKDGRWRMGDHTTLVRVDPLSSAIRRPIVERGKIWNFEQMVDAALTAARKVAVIVKFYETAGNESRRPYWQHWLDRELSTLSQASGIDYEIVVTGSALPSRSTIEQWEREVNVLDSEDQAKLRHWEAVCHFWVSVEDKDTADVEWALHVEGEAEESRHWALEKRDRLLRRYTQFRRHSDLLSTGPARSRFGTRARESHGRTDRSRGSRRVTGRSAGGGSSGDDPDGEPGPGDGGGNDLLDHAAIGRSR
jgi:hypothetical protein